MPADQLIGHAQRTASRHDWFPFALDHVELNAEHDGRNGSVFLVPRTGRAEVVALHDDLYTGPLIPELRTDLPFVPHVTIASGRLESCREIVRAVQAEFRPVLGAVLQLGIVALGGESATALARVWLAPRLTAGAG